ncbi:sulfotransferase family protein [Streptomyces tendae]|uniref:sulfotransferase family protein n=1 Tax=Streptomyces tendae TaxID=1932 RepID=UPI0036A59BFA
MLIVGTERSGSNLLRLILNSHSEIAVPHPPHLMRYLAPLEDSYGDLREERNLRALVADADLLVRRHIHPWEHPVDREEVVRTADPSVFGVVSAFYEQYRRAEKKNRWGCKSTFMVEHIDKVVDLYPRARFLWLVRDPRDVAVSAQRSVFGPSHPYRTARLWAAQQELGHSALRRYGSGQVHFLRYEDLVSDPGYVLREVCDFLGVRWESGLLSHHRSAAARNISALSESWAGAGKPIFGVSVGRYERELPERQRALVESVAGPAMRELRYPVVPAQPACPPARLALLLSGACTRLAIECRSLLHDRNFARRFLRDGTVRWLGAKALVRRGLRRTGRDQLDH